MGGIENWPWGAIVSLVGLILTYLGIAVKVAMKTLGRSAEQETEARRDGWTQVEHRNRQIDLLRSLLDRGRQRENAYATGFELLLIAMPHSPTEEQVRLIQRARELFETALVLRSGEGGRGK